MLKFDTQAINHAVVAISMEMAPDGRERLEDTATLFLGGDRLSDPDLGDLARFGMNKNYQIIFASYETAAPSGGRSRSTRSLPMVTRKPMPCAVVGSGSAHGGQPRCSCSRRSAPSSG